jgi:hypothetical protein
MDVRIGEVTGEIVVTESIGSLGPEDVKKLVALVLDHLRDEQARLAQRESDTTIHESVFRTAG